MAGILCNIGYLYLYVLFARILISWFPIQQGGALATVASFLYMVTEPVLGPLRRVIPAVRLGGMALDLSPIIVIFGLQLLVLPLLCSL